MASLDSQGAATSAAPNWLTSLLAQVTGAAPWSNPPGLTQPTFLPGGGPLPAPGPFTQTAPPPATQPTVLPGSNPAPDASPFIQQSPPSATQPTYLPGGGPPNADFGGAAKAVINVPYPTTQRVASQPRRNIWDLFSGGVQNVNDPGYEWVKGPAKDVTLLTGHDMWDELSRKLGQFPDYLQALKDANALQAIAQLDPNHPADAGQAALRSIVTGDRAPARDLTKPASQAASLAPTVLPQGIAHLINVAKDVSDTPEVYMHEAGHGLAFRLNKALGYPYESDLLLRKQGGPDAYSQLLGDQSNYAPIVKTTSGYDLTNPDPISQMELPSTLAQMYNALTSKPADTGLNQWMTQYNQTPVGADYRNVYGDLIQKVLSLSDQDQQRVADAYQTFLDNARQVLGFYQPRGTYGIPQ